MRDSDYINGFLERRPNGSYLGELYIYGINISPIDGVYFKDNGVGYLWLKRRRILEYDDVTETYVERDAKPKWEAYLKKQIDNNVVTYKGEFTFMRFRFSIIGIWDKVFGTDSRRRLNLIVERLPLQHQTIINSINERRRNEQQDR